MTRFAFITWHSESVKLTEASEQNDSHYKRCCCSAFFFESYNYDDLWDITTSTAIQSCFAFIYWLIKTIFETTFFFTFWQFTDNWMFIDMDISRAKKHLPLFTSVFRNIVFHVPAQYIWAIRATFPIALRLKNIWNK